MKWALLFLLLIAGHENDPNHAWFETLRSQAGSLCCSNADGKKVDDPNWGYADGLYWVIVDGKRLSVPSEAVVSVNNKVGFAVVWPFYNGVDPDPKIRCFLPGALS